MTQVVLFTPTAEQRNQVEVLAGFGLPQHQIAVLLGCDPKTLRKHFEQELERGSVQATAKVATAGKSVAAIFWMKARAGWREKHEVKVTTGDLSHLLDEELQRMVDEGYETWAAEKARKQALVLEGEVADGGGLSSDAGLAGLLGHVTCEQRCPRWVVSGPTRWRLLPRIRA